MSLVERVALSHFEHSSGSALTPGEKVEVKKVQELNELPLEDFQELPKETQEFAEDLWTAQVVEVNVRRQAERRTRIQRLLATPPLRGTKAGNSFSWR